MLGLALLLASTALAQASTARDPATDAALAWSSCAYEAAGHVYRLDESIEAAADIAVDVCPKHSLATSHAVEARGASDVVQAQERSLLRQLARARARMRIIVLRSCTPSDAACAAFFQRELNLPR
jgi:hypothetical protein